MSRMRWQIIAACICLASVTWLVFGQTLGHDFINYDDPGYVVANSPINRGLTLEGLAWAFSHRVSSNWHPLTMISHMLDCQLYGLNARGHHFTNVLLHTATVVLLFLVLQQMTAATWQSAFVAAIFAIHPLRAESVAWIAERKDVLSGLFFMLTLAAYLQYVRRPTFTRYALVVLVFICGLMSKPMLVSLPVVLMLLDYWPLRRFETFRKSVREKLPLFVIAALFCAVTLVAQQDSASPVALLPIWVRGYNLVINPVTYLGQMFWPRNLCLLYPLPSGALSGWFLIFATAVSLGITFVAVALRRRYPYLFTGWFWYLVMLAPVIGIIQVGVQLRADRYTYLPQIGLAMAFTWGVADLAATWRFRRAFLGIASVAAITILILLARIQTSYWKNSESLWTHTLAVTSKNAVAHQNLGTALLKNGRIDDAILHLQQALKIWPDYGHGKANADNARVHENLAAAFIKKGRLSEATFHFQKAADLKPSDADIQDKLANALWQGGNLDEAIARWRKILVIDVNNSSVHTQLATAFVRKGDVAEAIAHYEQSLAIAPDVTVTLNNFALVLATCPDARFRDGRRAVELAEKADELSGKNNPLVVRTLAAACAENRRFKDAIAAGERALGLAVTQKDAGLANDVRADLDLYRLELPRRITR